MSKKYIGWLTLVVIILIAVMLFFVLRFQNSKDPTSLSELDKFAQCINDSGAKFYNAFWCSHCQAQKTDFGKSQKYLPSIECSTPDGEEQTFVCQNQGIKGYPTWEFPDDTRQSGRLSFEVLAKKTNCSLPL